MIFLIPIQDRSPVLVHVQAPVRWSVLLSGCGTFDWLPNDRLLELANPDAEIWLRHDAGKLEFGYIVGGREKRPERSLKRIESHGNNRLEFSESGNDQIVEFSSMSRAKPLFFPDITERL